MLTMASRRLKQAVGLTMRRILFMMWKEVLELRQDPRIFSIIFIAPILQLTILGYAATTDVHNVPVVIVDADRSAASQALISRFSASGIFTIVDVVSSIERSRSVSGRRPAWMALSIPPRYGENLAARPARDAADCGGRIRRQLDQHRDGLCEQPDRRLRAGSDRAKVEAGGATASGAGGHRSAGARLVQPDASRAATSCCRASSRCCCWW